MTDQSTPDLAAIVAAVYEFRQNLAAAARRAWPRVAAALTPTQDEFALVPNDVAHEQPKPDHKRDLAALWALAACLNGDDQHAARLLAGLDAAQLYAIEGAASGLAIHASRHRKRLAQADADEQDGTGCPLDCPPGICRAAQERPDDAEQLGASTTGAAFDEIAGVDRLAPWERDLLAAKATEQQPEPARVRTRADLAAELREAGAKLDAMQFRAEAAEEAARRDEQRADEAEREQRRLAHERDEHSTRANTAERRLDIADRVTAVLKAERDKARAERDEERRRNHYERAANAERQAAEQKARAQRAEAEAADWRTTAHGYEQALRAEQADASLQVTRLTRERDRIRQRADAAEATIERVRQFAADLRRQLRVGFPTGFADRLDKILGIDTRDRTADPDAWRPDKMGLD